MKKNVANAVVALFIVPMVLAPLFVAPSAHAEDFYIGANYGPRTDGHIIVRESGVTMRRDAVTHQRHIGIFAGYVLSPQWALETGYDGVGGSTDYRVYDGRLKLHTQVAYLAARGTWKLNDDWSLFGKAGVAQGRLEIDRDWTGAGARAGTTVRKNGAYLGAGAAYAVANNVSLQLELERTPKIKHEGLTASTNKISLGARFGF